MSSSKPKKAEEQVAEHVEKPTKPATVAATGVVYVDATGHIAGRLCSEVASEILRGKRIVVLNADDATLRPHQYFSAARNLRRQSQCDIEFRSRFEILVQSEIETSSGDVASPAIPGVGVLVHGDTNYNRQ